LEQHSSFTLKYVCDLQNKYAILQEMK